MKSMKNLVAKLLLAVCMSAAAGVAAGSPLYHVDIDTSTLGTGTAYLGIDFLALGGAAPATATVYRLAGALVGPAQTLGAISGSLPGPLVFSNADGGSDLVQAITLGGHFSFDVVFAQDPGSGGTTFSWSLFDDTHYLGVDGDLGSFQLQPDAAPGQQLTVTAANDVSSTQVPEPSSVMLMLLAGGMLAAARRKRLG